MRINWKAGETYETDRPADIERGAAKVKVRRNITRETRTTETGTKRVWVYEYANMTLAQFEEYKKQLAELDTPFAQLITENNTVLLEATTALYEQQIMAEENQLAILEGLAALYEMGVSVE